jgi:neutral ceramidase
VPFLVGAAGSTITPALGTVMSGFGARYQRAQLVHDGLCCAAVVLDDGQTQVGIISCDLVGLPVPLAHSWRGHFSERTGIPAEHILISCTHTHSGPATGMLWDAIELGEREQAYLEHLKHLLCGALEAAVARMRPARLRLTRGTVRTQFNRRDRLDGGTGPVDDSIGVLRLDALDDGSPLAVLVHYTCHPTGLGPTNLGFSAEYPGWVRRTVENALGAPCLFLQGACGDHNPLSRRDRQTGPRTVEAQLAAMREQGTTIGGSAVRLAEGLKLDDGEAGSEPETAFLGAETRVFEAPLSPLPSLAEAEAWLDEANHQIAARLAAGGSEQSLLEVRRLQRRPQALVDLLRDGTGPLARTSGSASAGIQGSVPFELQVLRLGPLAIVGLPVEPLSEVGLTLRKLRPAGQLWCAGYANGCYGYLAPEHEYARGGYEVETAHAYYGQPAPFAPTCAAQVVDQAAAALANLIR